MRIDGIFNREIPAHGRLFFRIIGSVTVQVVAGKGQGTSAPAALIDTHRQHHQCIGTILILILPEGRHHAVILAAGKIVARPVKIHIAVGSELTKRPHRIVDIGLRRLIADRCNRAVRDKLIVVIPGIIRIDGLRMGARMQIIFQRPHRIRIVEVVTVIAQKDAFRIQKGRRRPKIDLIIIVFIIDLVFDLMIQMTINHGIRRKTDTAVFNRQNRHVRNARAQLGSGEQKIHRLSVITGADIGRINSIAAVHGRCRVIGILHFKIQRTCIIAIEKYKGTLRLQHRTVFDNGRILINLRRRIKVLQSLFVSIVGSVLRIRSRVVNNVIKPVTIPARIHRPDPLGEETYQSQARHQDC